MSPDILKKLANEGGFKVIKCNATAICDEKDEASYSEANLYYRRDLVALLQKCQDI